MIREQKYLFGAIEAGGTKMVCAIGAHTGRILDRIVIPTRMPDETLHDISNFFVTRQSTFGEITALGVGSFGPVDIDEKSSTYGRIGKTPKPGWAGVNLVDELSLAIGVPIIIDTDVNCALMAEADQGAGAGLQDLVYLTIGTGIGGGVMVGGRIVYGTGHPEIGHSFIPKAADDADFEGACPYHGDRCAEGLACGPAIQKRWGSFSHELPPGHAAWDLQARYLAILCHNLFMTTSPQRIILGGGVMKQEHVFPLLRGKLQEISNGYGAIEKSPSGLLEAIVPPGLNGDAGMLGALLMARCHAEKNTKAVSLA